MDACLAKAVTLGIYRIFVLANQETFPPKLGFAEAAKDSLSQHVLADCVDCPHFPGWD